MGLMDFFGRAQAAAAAPGDRDAGDDYWYEPLRLNSQAGESVTVERARTVPVVRACLKILSDSIAGLSFGVFERDANDDRHSARGHWLQRLLADPNPRDTSFEFFANLVDDLAAEGMFLAEWVSPGDSAQALWRIPRQHYTVEVLRDRSRRFRVREPGQPERVLLDEEVWFIAVPPYANGVTGRSAILGDGKEAIGAALALQAYAARFFRNDATPPFVFKHKGQFKDEASKKNFLSAWSRFVGGRNRGKPAVLEFDMDLQTLASTNEQSQFLETRKELWLDIARLWRIPPHKVGILDRATFSNIEQQSLEFVTDTLSPWLELIERSIGKTFLRGNMANGSEYFEFNVASLLRGDIKTRFDAYALARQWGWLSVNEIRRMENRNGIGAAGDRYIEPLSMTPVGVPADEGRSTQAAIAFLRNSVAANGGRPKLKVIRNAA